jgi:hypothetical protein
MNIMKLKQIIGLAVVLSTIAFGHASVTFALSADGAIPAPALPSGCEALAAPAGHEAVLKVYAVGVQIYRWNGTSWAFVAPEANLFASPNYRGLIGTHYGGPTWESNSGSLVVSSGTTAVPCTPDPTAIPWLRLTAVSSNGPGVFDGVTYIQRVNTVGGLRPAAPGETIGQEARIPYTTEYYFYKLAE